MQCIILAGGLGTRMLPLTQNIPKSLIDINGNPFIYYQLMWLKKHSINNVLINIGHYGYMIKDYVGNGAKFSLNVDYVDEGENLLETAGAIRLAHDQNKLDNSFIVIYGDSFLPIDYNRIYNYYLFSQSKALMTIYKNNNLLDKSNVLTNENKNTITYDKDYKIKSQNEYNYIDYGLSILNKQIINENVPPNQKYKLSDLFFKLSTDDILTGYEVYDRFFEIGSFAGLKDFKDWVDGKANNP